MPFSLNIDVGIFCLNELYEKLEGFYFERADQQIWLHLAFDKKEAADIITSLKGLSRHHLDRAGISGPMVEGEDIDFILWL